MKKTLMAALAWCIVATAPAQDVVFEKELKLKRNLVDHREAYPVVDAAGKTVSLFLVDKDGIQGFFFDDQFNLTDALEGPRPDNKFTDLIGSLVSGDSYNLVFATKKRDDFVRVNVNYQARTVESTPLSLPLEREKFVGSVTGDSGFHILTSIKGSSVLNLHSFDPGFHYSVHAFDFPEVANIPLPASLSPEKTLSLFDMLQLETPVYVDNTLPNPLDITSALGKLYCLGNQLVLTLDHSLAQTQMITFDLNTFESSVRSFPHASVRDEEFNASANSYLLGKRLYQVKMSLAEMNFRATDLESNKVVAAFTAEGNDPITFKNGPIIMEKTGAVNSNRKLNKTKQFLKKASTSSVGISVYEARNALLVVLGSYEKINRSYGTTSGMVSGGGNLNTPYGAMAAPSYYNPTFASFSAYSYSKSAFFKSKLDPENLTHLDGDVPANAFDKIGQFTKAMGGELKAETLFRLGDAYILGYYDKAGSNKYVMRKFSD